MAVVCARLAVPAALLAQPVPGSAQELGWRVTPSLIARETYTDNVRLAPRGQTESEFITEIIPRLRVGGASPRLRADIEYAPSFVYFANEKTGRIRNSLAGIATGEIIDNFFFLEGVGRIYQGALSPLGPVPSDTATLSNNRVETRTFGLNPYVRGRIGGDTIYTLRNNNTWTSSTGDGLVDAYSIAYLGHIENLAGTFGWSADYDRRETRYSGQPSLNMQLYRGRLHYRASPDLTVFAGGGYEQNNFFLSNRSSPIYGGGFTWRPIERSVISGSAEHRFFGTGYAFNVNHRGSLFAFTAGLTRDASTFPIETLRQPASDPAVLLDAALLGQFPNPVERRAAVDDLLRQAGVNPTAGPALNFYSRRVVLINRAEGALLWTGAQNTIVLSVFRVETTSLVDDQFAQIIDLLSLRNDYTTRGANVSFTHRFTPVFSANVLLGRTRVTSKGTTVQTSTQDLLRVQAIQALSSRTSVFGGLRFIHYTTDADGFGDLNERAVYVGLEHRF